jgi:Tol biopolymer transport system component
VHGANDMVMGWSPDGTRLLFSSDRRGSVGLWALPFANGKVQGPPELLKSDIGKSYSLGLTDSRALYVYKPVSTRDITIAPVDLNAGKLLGPPMSFTQGFIENPGPPYWSPDGKYLAYQVNSCNQGCIAIRSVATGQVRRVASNLTNARAVHWSPDGRSLLTKGADRSGREGIFRIDVQSGEASTVIFGDGLSTLAQWSPDGKKVYFNFNPTGRYVERDLASGAERELYREAGVRNGSLSPDGRYLAVVRTDLPSKTASLLLVPVAGGPPLELLRLTQPEALAPVNVWTHDSSGVIITKDTGSRIELWLVPVTGGPQRKLDIDPNLWSGGSSSELLSGFTLSPDGRSIAFQTGKTVSEVWALENFLPAPTAKK